jgi:hypothetical protein
MKAISEINKINQRIRFFDNELNNKIDNLLWLDVWEEILEKIGAGRFLPWFHIKAELWSIFLEGMKK